MKYCRFQLNSQAQYGLIESVAGKDQITRTLSVAPHLGDGDLEDLPSKKITPIDLSAAELLAPVQPSKIVCIGRNYRAHAAELGNEVPTEPLIFLKPPSSLLAPKQTVLRPKISERVDYEGELGVVIGRKCRHLKPGEDVRPYVLGYTCINDVTARDLQRKDGQWTRGKGFDTFCPVGPWIVPRAQVPFDELRVRTVLDGEVQQDGSVRDMIFPVSAIIAYVTQFMTLEPGDLIATGTPSGVGP